MATFDFYEIPEHAEATGNPPTRTTHWRAVGSSSESYVQAVAISSTPATVVSIYGLLYRQDVRVRQTAYNQWDVDIPYARNPNASGEWSWDFDTTGATIHILNSKQTIAAYPASPTPPDHKMAIGVNGDEVAGTEKVLPALKINVHFKHPTGIITLTKAKYLASITGVVNSAAFLGFAAGEVLFLGARGSDGTVAEAAVSYMFAMSSNATGLTIGTITGVAKKGWETAWIRWQDTVDAGQPVRRPQYVYVERIYDTVDLATALGFGS